LTIHDLLNLQYPQFATFKQRFIAKISALSAPRAEVVMVPSRYSRSELLRLSNCREASIKVIYHGCGFDFSTTASVEYKDNFKNCEPFFLFVGADYPRRNVPGLIKAFAEVKSELSRPINLIIAGTSTRLKFLQETIKDNNVTDNVRLLGHIDDEMLKYLYLHALAFVYPSRYEGFGMPILEAMSAGLPVIVPDCPPYDEVAGEAGIYFNPDDPEGMKKAMIRVISNPALREEYSQKSRLQASHFSWETAARQILELIKQFEIGK
jgi:glycosyltransferase involved in cell wall biosynthesis